MFDTSTIALGPRKFWIGILLISQMSLGLLVILVPMPYLALLLLPIPLVIIYHKPLLGYLVLIAFLPNYGIDLYKIGGTMDVSLLEPAVFIALIGLCMQFLKERKLRIHVTEVEITLFLLYAWAACSILWSPDKTRAFQQIIKISIGYVIYMLSITMIKDKKDFNTVVGMWLFLILVMSAVSILEVFGGGFSAADKYIFTPGYDKIHKDVRTTAMFEGADMVGFLTSFTVIIFISYLLFTPRGRLRTTLYVGVLLALFMLITAMARKSFLGLGASLFFMILFLPRESSKRLLWYISGAFGLILLVLLTLGTAGFLEALGERLSSLFMEPTEAAKNRMEAWQVGFMLFAQSPVLGSGLGSFFHIAVETESHLRFPHSFFVFIISELGLIGFSLFLLLIFQTGRRFAMLKKNTPHEATKILAVGITAGLISILVQMGFRSISLTDPTFWGFLGLALAFLKISSSDLGTRVTR